MEVPLEITFQNLDVSPAIEAAIRGEATKLERFAADIVSCRVTVEEPHRRHRKGNLFAVHVDIRFSGGEAVASHESGAKHEHEDAHRAVRDAFRAVRRQLQDRVRMRRGDVKPHEPPPQRVLGKHHIVG